ncbi:MAG: prolyl oligopeptidase family serine peptidase [Ardenticatenaceae bacterium]|nr:prolyl oligopeptidase family serine peptidase [Ardenticatenaceae bacterium]
MPTSPPNSKPFCSSWLCRLFVLGLYGGLFLLVGPLSAWLLIHAQTAIGTMLATLGLLSLLLPFFWFIQQRSKTVFVRGLLGLTILAMGALSTAVLLQAPSGNPGENSPVQHRFVDGGQYGRFSLTNLVPESEQVNLGFTLMPYVDPLLTVEQSRRVSPITMGIYREMEQDPNFHKLGSAMNLAYDELWGRPFDIGHYYLYVPQNAGAAPLPAIVFLHGSAGNFKAYTWLWSKLAESDGYVIIAPSYGFGNWDEAGAASVLQFIEDAKQVANIDENRLYLAGLSNGGLGVSYLANLAPKQFRGLIFLSPVMATEIVDSAAFKAAWGNRPVLVISGEADNRIPLTYVEQRIAAMQQANIEVISIIYPNEDHFLVFSQPQSVMQNVSVWLKAQD